jgi:hypothetical protein
MLAELRLSEGILAQLEGQKTSFDILRKNMLLKKIF